jgi:hypothetical protein
MAHDPEDGQPEHQPTAPRGGRLRPFTIRYSVSFLVRVHAPRRADAERALGHMTLADALALHFAWSLERGTRVEGVEGGEKGDDDE